MIVMDFIQISQSPMTILVNLSIRNIIRKVTIVT